MSTEAIEKFLMRPDEGGAYTDERLAMLLAHAQDGKLEFASCCCLVGIPTADHALQGKSNFTAQPHYVMAVYGVPTWEEAAETNFRPITKLVKAAEVEAHALAVSGAGLCVRLIPLILAEMDRRASLISTQVTCNTKDNNASLHSQASLPEEVFA